MNRGHVLQSSPYVQQIMAGGNPNWWIINNMSPSSQSTASSFMAPPPPLPPNLFPQYIIPPPPPPPDSSSPSLPISSSWNDGHQELPESWSQLLLGGLVGEEDKASSLNNMQIMSKKIQNWEEDLLQQNQTTVDIKQENSMNNFSTNTMYGIHHGNNAELFQTTPSGKPSWSQMMPVSSPNSCVTTLSSTNNILNFSSKFGARHPPPSHSSECNSTPIGGVTKKARVQPSTTQSTFKVRKEKLGDRITALHQIVSPFGKTDTASVLLEAIGYIRFLQNQIEALSLPYLDSGSGNLRQQQHVKGDRNCLFPEDPGQLLNDGFNKKKGIPDKEPSDEEAKKDLRSRGLCLVPIPCTMQVGCDNGADFWGPAVFNGGFR